MMKTLDLTEAAAMLKMSADAVMGQARSGRHPVAKIGRQRVFLELDLI